MTVPLLHVDRVSVAFGGLRALDDVCIDVPPGQIVGLIGPNGAGKTTLFNTISALQKSDAGSVVMNGQDITRLSASRRSRLGIARSFQHLGLMGQETVGVNLMAAQHVDAGYSSWDMALRPWRWRRGENQLRDKARVIAKELELNDLWDIPVSALSFGPARFVEIACVLLRDPQLLLLDEPTTGLDVNEVDRLAGLLHAARERGTSVLVVAHDTRFVMETCDYIYVLAEGRNLASGTPEQVRSDPAVVSAYLGRSA